MSARAMCAPTLWRTGARRIAVCVLYGFSPHRAVAALISDSVFRSPRSVCRSRVNYALDRVRSLNTNLFIFEHVYTSTLSCSLYCVCLFLSFARVCAPCARLSNKLKTLNASIGFYVNIGKHTHTSAHPHARACKQLVRPRPCVRTA